MVTRPIHNSLEDLTITSRILGFNISGAKTIVVYGDMNGFVFERMQLETPSEAPFLECFDAICAQADKLLKVCRAQGLPSPEVISLAVSGPMDILKGFVLSPPDLPQWDDAQIKGRLTVRYNLPVFIEHRSQAAALAEAYFGAGIGVQDLALIDMEPVVGAGLILQGRGYHGATDAAGEIGRMQMTPDGPAGLGQPGSLTGYASGFGMAELAALRFPQRWLTPPEPYDLVQAVNAGEQGALAVIAEAGSQLGKALAWLAALLDPELIVLGHPGDVLGEALMAPLRESLMVHAGPAARHFPRLIAAQLGGKLDDVAALMAVIDQYKSQPATER